MAETRKTPVQEFATVFFSAIAFFLIDYSEVTLQTSEALALPLWGSCTSGTAVEGVVNEDVAVHAEQMSTLRT